MATWIGAIAAKRESGKTTLKLSIVIVAPFFANRNVVVLYCLACESDKTARERDLGVSAKIPLLVENVRGIYILPAIILTKREWSRARGADISLLVEMHGTYDILDYIPG